MTDVAKNNVRMARKIVLVVAGMVALSYASVPLYDLFCKVTGYGGTTQQAVAEADRVIDRVATVRFAANTAQQMPWEFRPMQNKQSVRIGEKMIAYYEAYNPTDRVITGTATYNVAPFKAGEYFAKIECFCFTEQVLQPGERVEMPIVYYIDPDIDQDRNVADVTEITLSYTFFEQESEGGATASGK